MSVYKRGKGTHWHYYFRVRGVRYRGALPEARTKKQAENKRSWKGDQCYSEVLKDYFKGKSLCEITPLLVEKFKHERIKTPTKYGRARAEASVNREFEMLSRVFNLAIDFKNAEMNPCSRVRSSNWTMSGIATFCPRKNLCY
jgi:hypothetical protein